ncbi:MAG: zinc-finger domain-containing protein [Alphaproteobacteria bacterium]|nr:zinc-finger domain-containing protein [Alphaproteobacteria bacterium]
MASHHEDAQMTPGQPNALPAPEVITVTSRRLKCDGGGGALGHPVVFYDMGEADFVECLYCDRRFVLAVGAGDHDH